MNNREKERFSDAIDEDEQEEQSERPEINPNAPEVEGESQELNPEQPNESDQEIVRDKLIEIRTELSEPSQEEIIPATLHEQFVSDSESFKTAEKKSGWRKFVSRLNIGKASKMYDKYPQVAEGNDPESENFYLRKIDEFNEQQEQRAEGLGFNRRYAFISHIHSRGVEDWKDGSDGSYSPEEILEEYRKAIVELKEQGIEEVFVAITDHQSIGNSIKLAELLEAEGLAKPLMGVEAANNEGYEVLSYTTDVEKLRKLSEDLEKRKSRFVRYGKTGYSGEELIARLAQDDFVMGLAHPSAKKTIMMGGAMIDRIEEDPKFKQLVEDNMVFYEGVNWYQNTYGSNCLSFSMREQMEEMSVLAFNGEDFHSKVSGSEDRFFNGNMFNEIRTDQELNSGEDLLNLLRKQKQDSSQPQMVNMLRGTPALPQQYNEHINNGVGRVVADTFRAIFDFGLKKRIKSAFGRSST
jgi:hypothetical protein